MEGMEIYWYECPECGFAHQVPAYWVSFQKDPTYEFPHSNLETKQMCGNVVLRLREE